MAAVSAKADSTAYQARASPSGSVLAYANSHEHLQAELARMSLLLRIAAARARSSDQARIRSDAGFAEEDLFALLDAASALSNTVPSHLEATLIEAYEDVELLARGIAERCRESANQGVALRLVMLADRLELTRLDLDILLLTLLVDLDRGTESLLACIDPRGHGRLTVGSAIDALIPHPHPGPFPRGKGGNLAPEPYADTSDLAARLAVRSRLSSDAPLRRYALVYLNGEPPQNGAPLVSYTIAINERIVTYLQGDDGCSSGSQSHTSLVEPRASLEDLLPKRGQKLAALARRIPATFGWDDLVLPPDRKAMLRELCLHVKHRSQVLGDWGFERKLGRGHPVTGLFCGPPGTGKTMAAGVIAAELGLEMYHIDLSRVVSKYIGETEKHLAEVFEDAEAANVALFFDEADALFGKRTEVRDAHDRYANIETSYLLQRIETYEGVVILASNMVRNMDDAFVRRIGLIVEFPFPDAADRLEIWQRIWPTETPLAADVDLGFLAERVELSGGFIRNMALGAAFVAAEEGVAIGMKHLMHAAGREYQKMGKMVDIGRLSYMRSA